MGEMKPKPKLLIFLRLTPIMSSVFQGGRECRAIRSSWTEMNLYSSHSRRHHVSRDKNASSATGVVLDPTGSSTRIAELKERGIDVEGPAFISQKAHLSCPTHKLAGPGRGGAQGKNSIGTTGARHRPGYRDKAARVGIRLVDLLNREVFCLEKRHIKSRGNDILTKIYGYEPLKHPGDRRRLLRVRPSYRTLWSPISPCCSTTRFKAGRTCSSRAPRARCSTSTTGPTPMSPPPIPSPGRRASARASAQTWVSEVIGVMKAYTTRVGNGPFPRIRGPSSPDGSATSAASTAPPLGGHAAAGGFDGIIGRYAARYKRAQFPGGHQAGCAGPPCPRSKSAPGYRHGGRILENFPADITVLGAVEPVYETHPAGWNPPAMLRRHEDLPANAALLSRPYLPRIVETPIKVRVHRLRPCADHHVVEFAGKNELKGTPSLFIGEGVFICPSPPPLSPRKDARARGKGRE